MNRRNFLTISALSAAALACGVLVSGPQTETIQTCFGELTEYKIPNLTSYPISKEVFRPYLPKGAMVYSMKLEKGYMRVRCYANEAVRAEYLRQLKQGIEFRRQHPEAAGHALTRQGDGWIVGKFLRKV